MATNAASPQAQVPDNERECWAICRDRFKYVILMGAVIQHLLLFVFTVIMTSSYFRPFGWMREGFSIFCSPLMFVSVIHGYCMLKPFIEEQVHHTTRIAKFVKSFGHNSAIFFLNVFIGLFTSLIFARHLQADYSTISSKADGKKFLNEKYAFLVLNGIFIRCYFYFKRSDNSSNITFPMIHQSKFLQLRRQIVTVVRSFLWKPLLPLAHYLAFYTLFGGVLCCVMRKFTGLNAVETSIIESFAIVLNVRLLIYSWILSALIWSNLELMDSVFNIFATEPKQFAIEGSGSLLLVDALSLSKFHITQQLAAQDLYLLSESPNSFRRNKFYALSNPGGHPHNWKQLVQKSLKILNVFTDELKTIDSTNRNNNFVVNNFNQPMHHFYESKRMIREFNEFSGIRSLATSPLKQGPVTAEKQTNYVELLKKKLLSYRWIFYFFGETEGTKLNFLLNQNTQTIIWISQGLSAIISRSLEEDSYGVVQQDIKQILKSFIKLKVLLDKVGAANVIAKDRNFIALKAALRRSLYRISNDFSGYFEDLLLDPEDVRALHAFVTFKEL